MNNPFSPADAPAFLLVIVGILMLYDGLMRGSNVYIGLAILEFVLAGAQIYHLRR